MADTPATAAELRIAYDAAKTGQAELATKIEAYKDENATNNIPNTMELARVTLETKVDQARLALSEAIKLEKAAAPAETQEDTPPKNKAKK